MTVAPTSVGLLEAGILQALTAVSIVQLLTSQLRQVVHCYDCDKASDLDAKTSI